jgi:hypothetical protein
MTQYKFVYQAEQQSIDTRALTLAVQEVVPKAEVVETATVILIVNTLAWSPDLRTWMPVVSANIGLIIGIIALVVAGITAGIVYYVRMATVPHVIYVKITDPSGKGD